jgi:hypothetical protein
LRRLRIAAPAQLPLALEGTEDGPASRWSSMPEAARQQALVLLARLIAKGVIDSEDVADG